MASEGNDEFNSVIESLMNMFSGVLNKEVIITVAESCGGDLNLSMDAIMNITNDGNSIQDQVHSKKNKSEELEEPSQTTENTPVSQNAAPKTENQNTAANSFALTLKNSTPTNSSKMSKLFSNNVTHQPSTSQPAPVQTYGAIPKVSPAKFEWTDQVRRIVENHNKGSRIVILMRGAPGSGKTHLAQQLVEIMVGGTYVNFRTHICSTDDYFMSRGRYYFNKHNLSEAHAWNQNRARLAMIQGLSPIVIDNTNIEIWEMEPYVRNAVQNGYIIEVVEPNTAWARKANQLARKNIHNVPITTIKRMIENYQNNITGDYLIKYYGLSYPSDRIPPVLRVMPAFQPLDAFMVPSTSTTTTRPVFNDLVPDNMRESSEEAYIAPQLPVQSIPQSFPRSVEAVINDCELDTSIEQPNIIESVTKTPPTKSPEPNQNENTEVGHDFEIVQECVSSIDYAPQVEEVEEHVNLRNQYLEVQKQLEEIEKVEQEWENGENWEDVPENNCPEVDKDTEINCPKPPRGQSNTGDNLTDIVGNVQDWRQYMPPWHNEPTPTTKPATIPKITVETTTSGTSMESGDFDQARNNFIVISACPRDINLYHISDKKEKIPDKRMLDKSTMTNEQLLTEASHRCLNEEKHFRAFRKLFKNINKTALRDIFDQCMGDVNWAVEIVLDGVAANQIATEVEEQISDEEVSDEMCTCLSAYHVVPDTSSQTEVATVATQDDISAITGNISTQKKPSKREVVMSEASVELKRQIEQNVVIADNHYSQHCLKIMRHRRGYPDTLNALEENQPSTSQYQDVAAYVGSDDEVESTSSAEEVEKTVNISLGKEFIAELDKLFGRTDMSYPDTLVPKINIPLSLLNEINALWMESLMHQFDEHERQRAKILQEDEDFAKALALKEAELAVAGQEPEVLDFKEIMDMDLALSIYQRDVAGWRDKEPTDLAAKLTRDKLYSLFPDVPNDILAELLMAHDNNFQYTVEVLLMSTGRASVLKEKNGVNKFVTAMEMERQAKALEAERKALSEVEWPLLPRGEVPDMSVVKEYRTVADRHLISRNMNIQKARDYVNRGMLHVAGYYKELAEFHKLKFEQSNSLAAASLMQLHAAKCPDSATIDLHYLRVNEAKESLDLFIDMHIQKLKSNQGRGARHHTLYFITGRGLHSHGRPKIKPAVQKRLRERGLRCNEVNPGLLSTRVCADDFMTHQLA